MDTIDATGISGTILLTSGSLEVYTNVTINGPGPANLAVNGNATYCVFDIWGSPSHNGDVVISGLTITNGVGHDNYPNPGPGRGGIYNDDMVGSLILENCTVSNNVSGVDCCHGGGIYNLGSGSISNNTISANTSGAYGGGISSTYYLSVDNSIISGNSAGNAGGGIYK